MYTKACKLASMSMQACMHIQFGRLLGTYLEAVTHCFLDTKYIVAIDNLYYLYYSLTLEILYNSYYIQKYKQFIKFKFE